MNDKYLVLRSDKKHTCEICGEEFTPCGGSEFLDAKVNHYRHKHGYKFVSGPHFVGKGAERHQIITVKRS